jgi:antibiotic biosynthesis monooxygenase (ABM) superfamily enzyme
MPAFEALSQLLVPQPANHHRAKILHEPSLSFILFFFLCFQLVLSFIGGMTPFVLGFASNITASRVVELTNRERTREGFLPLTVTEKLNEVAREKAADMFAFNYWAHVSPSGRDPWVFFKEAGYDYVYAGENLARDFADSESVVKAWMNSPTHRDNILNKNYSEIGLAVVNGTLKGVETTLVVQVLGSPAKGNLLAKVVPPVRASLGESNWVANNNSPKISPFWLTKTVVIFILGMILGALLVDLLFVSQKRVIRLSGKNWAHLVFIGTLFLVTLLTTQGAIL